MTHTLTVVQWLSIVFILLPITILWINNRVLSARKPSSQMLLGGTLFFALFAADSSSMLMMACSIALFGMYTYTLCQYYAATMTCVKRREQLPHGKRP